MLQSESETVWWVPFALRVLVLPARALPVPYGLFAFAMQAPCAPEAVVAVAVVRVRAPQPLSLRCILRLTAQAPAKQREAQYVGGARSRVQSLPSRGDAACLTSTKPCASRALAGPSKHDRLNHAAYRYKRQRVTSARTSVVYIAPRNAVARGLRLEPPVRPQHGMPRLVVVYRGPCPRHRRHNFFSAYFRQTISVKLCCLC